MRGKCSEPMTGVWRQIRERSVVVCVIMKTLVHTMKYLVGAVGRFLVRTCLHVAFLPMYVCVNERLGAYMTTALLALIACVCAWVLFVHVFVHACLFVPAPPRVCEYAYSAASPCST